MWKPKPRNNACEHRVAVDAKGDRRVTTTVRVAVAAKDMETVMIHDAPNSEWDTGAICPGNNERFIMDPISLEHQHVVYPLIYVGRHRNVGSGIQSGTTFFGLTR